MWVIHCIGEDWGLVNRREKFKREKTLSRHCLVNFKINGSSLVYQTKKWPFAFFNSIQQSPTSNNSMPMKLPKSTILSSSLNHNTFPFQFFFNPINLLSHLSSITYLNIVSIIYSLIYSLDLDGSRFSLFNFYMFDFLSKYFSISLVL